MRAEQAATPGRDDRQGAALAHGLDQDRLLSAGAGRASRRSLASPTPSRLASRGGATTGERRAVRRRAPGHPSDSASEEPPCAETAATARDPARPEARRRPLRLRPVEGPPRAARSASPRDGADGHGHLAPPAAGQGRRRARPRRPARAVLAARRLRGRARQRRHDGLLGRRRLRPRPRARAAPDLRRVLPSSPRSRGGAPFLADPIVVAAEPGDAPRAARPTRRCDVVAWAHNETSTGVMVPRPPPARRRRSS